MADEKKEVVKDERPIFRVAQQHFASGLKVYEKGEEIVWEVPPDWDTKKNGRHFASYGPSITFEAVNPPAQKMLDEHKKYLIEKNKPKASIAEEMLAETRKTNEINQKLVAQNQKMLEMLVDLVEGLSKKK